MSIFRRSILNNRVEDFIADIFNPFRIFFRYLGVLRDYSVFLWKHHCDWDWTTLLLLLQFQMKRLRNSIANGYHLNQDRYVRQIRICEILIDRIIEDDYCIKEFEDHVQKWGKLSWKTIKSQGCCRKLDSKYPNAKTDIENTQAHKEKQAIYKKQKLMKKQDVRFLFMIMGKYLEHWWD